MRYSRDGFSIESAKRKGRPLPDWYTEAPEISMLDSIYLDAFWFLHTTRAFGMDIGPIPWDKCLLYAQYLELDRDLTECFFRIIFALDAEFLKWHAQVMEKQSKGSGIKPPKKTKG